MSKTTQTCPFCDSKRHCEADCAHGFDGKRRLLENCMLMNEIPDFKSYTKKELKFIAYITPNKKTILRTMGSDEWEYDPIALTLCKSILERDLKERWETMQEANKQEKHPMCNTGCSICTGKRKETYSWSIETGEWSLSESESKYEEKITTKCGHTFCKPCLDTVNWWPNYVKQRPISRHPIHNHVSHYMSRDVTVHYKNCPVCKKALHEDASDLLREDYYYDGRPDDYSYKLET